MISWKKSSALDLYMETQVNIALFTLISFILTILEIHYMQEYHALFTLKSSIRTILEIYYVIMIYFHNILIGCKLRLNA